LTPTTISPTRLVAFSDGIFAIAITLLVFNLKIPDLPAGSHGRLFPALIGMMPHFITYVMSFLLVAVFWFIHHHMFNHIVRVDNAFIWINVLYLLGISFLPFPSALLGEYPDERCSLIFYIASMSFVGLMLMSMWSYASYGHRLIEKDMPKAMIRYYYMRGLSSQLVFILTIVLALINLSWGRNFLLILIPIQALLQRRYKKMITTTVSRKAGE
jgi:uncharacterized membrane protein